MDTKKEGAKKNICVGILAHVDAGKTTLSEAMLYLSGRIKKLGRVDHRDSFLDTHELERERGITIFSKQAMLEVGDTAITLLDTPGHVDFSGEAERALQVMDYAVLALSGTAGVQAHTRTLWQLLESYHIPTFIFITKMDLPVCDRKAITADILAQLGESCVDFGTDEEVWMESAAMCSEKAMERYLEKGMLDDSDIAELVRDCKLHPCFFGSGLKTDGVDALLYALDKYTLAQDYGDEFGAKVFKIARDTQGQRMSFVKVTGGELKVRSLLKYKNEQGEEKEEKVNQLRLYSGSKFTAVDSVGAGQVCAVLGLGESWPGQGLGIEKDAPAPILEPVMSYNVILPPKVDHRLFLPKLMLLQEEEPLFRILWDARRGGICVHLMGRVQQEIFKSLVKDRFDVEVTLDAGRVLYKETIADKVEGVGHFEPLRHYAEVHLIMEPLPRGSGIVVDTLCSEDELDRNWQRLILTHVLERSHPGVLTGSAITDMKISLAAGRAHIKHTEGGDFRQATYRAIRQGLMQAKSVLLEPYYAFTMDLPPEQIGRAISDIRAMNGHIEPSEDAGDMTRLTGYAPVAAMSDYMEELVAYTHGRGRLSLKPDGYRPCKNQQAIVDAIGYSAEADVDNPADSVFCSHGAGVNIKWDKVREYMHLESVLSSRPAEVPVLRQRRSLDIDERELEAIMEREFGPIKRPEYKTQFRNEAPAKPVTISQKRDYIIVDGYNLIFAWDELKALAKERLDLARGRLMDMLSNYAGFTKAKLVLVFDGYRNPGSTGSKTDYHNIHVAYTKDGETADAYIERLLDEIGKNYSVRVITSDNLIRVSAMRSGVLRTSSGEFSKELEWTLEQIEQVLNKTNLSAHKTLLKDGKQ